MFKSQCTYWMDRITTQQATATAAATVVTSRWWSALHDSEWKSIDFRINLNIFTTTYSSICSKYWWAKYIQCGWEWMEKRQCDWHSQVMLIIN